MSPGWWVALGLTGYLFIGWAVREPVIAVSEPLDWDALSPEARARWRTLVEVPVRTPDQWEATCAQGGRRKVAGMWIDPHCTIQVVVDCPPDCGVYKILREDKLLRRVW